MRIFITGMAGFIGSAVAQKLLSANCEILGVDDLNGYYDPGLKRARIEGLAGNVTFRQLDIADHAALRNLVRDFAPARVIHLAAQAGVRYSLDHPFAYSSANLHGHLSILEACRHSGSVEKLIYASSSSVYGGNKKLPFNEEDPVCEPVSLYAATKRSDELLSQSYAHLYDLQQIGLRFFTVYGPWGRPDMAYWIFARKMLAGESIPVFNQGKMRRDFTYIDDIVQGVTTVCLRQPMSPNSKMHEIYNIGNHKDEELGYLIELLEKELGVPAKQELLPMQPGDVARTYADISKIGQAYGFEPKVSLAEGIAKFSKWFKAIGYQFAQM